MLGKDRNQILVFGLAAHGKRIYVRVSILSILRIICVKILIKDFDFHLVKCIPDVFQRLVPMDKLDFKPLVGIHMYDSLHHLQNDHDHQACYQCHCGESGTNSQTQAGSAPQGGRSGQAGDPPVGDDDCSGSKETNA